MQTIEFLLFSDLIVDDCGGNNATYRQRVAIEAVRLGYNTR
jgi:hypothetical protein